MALSRNLIYDIAPFEPNILYTFRCLSRRYQTKVEEVDYFKTFLKETAGVTEMRHLNWREIFWDQFYNKISKLTSTSLTSVRFQLTDPTAGQGADEAGSGADGHGGDQQDGRLDVQAQVAAEPGQGEGGRAGRGR